MHQEEDCALWERIYQDGQRGGTCTARLCMNLQLMGNCDDLTQLFLNRELWGIARFCCANATRCKKFTEGRSSGYIASMYVERMFVETLSNYLQFARDILKAHVPLQLEARLDRN